MSAAGRTPWSAGASLRCARWSGPTVRWNPPGAMSTRPTATASPSCASLTASGEIESRRRASADVKPGGMCCTTTTAAPRFAGNRGTTWLNAGGPPVEEQMTITRGFCSAPRASSRPTNWSRWRRCCTRASLARSTASASWFSTLMSSWLSVPGLPTHSTAPASSARIAVSVPSIVRVETITMGVGTTCMISSTARMPSIFGISTSMVMTSGRSSRALRTASTPSHAVSMTTTPGSFSRRRWMARRMNAESSAMSTRTCLCGCGAV